MSATVIAGNLRDLSYIAANLCQSDRAEIDCQFDQWSPEILAAMHLRDECYVVVVDGNPEAAIGLGRASHHALRIAWSFGTCRVHRAAPLMTKLVKELIIPAALAEGVQRVEARALAANHRACRWLERLGANKRSLLPSYGKDGEDFYLYDWLRGDYPDVLVQHPDASAAGIANSPHN